MMENHDRLRDKDYIITKDDLIFNVLGYEHPPQRTMANLKYVNGEKWLSGYPAAVKLLKEKYPLYIDNRGFVSVPDTMVGKICRPKEGLIRLLAEKNPNRVQKTAVELFLKLSDFFVSSLSKFGITDSLLWGPGKSNSDIDAVVFGRDTASLVRKKLPSLFELPEFERFDPSIFKEPPGVPKADFEKICERKLNFGYFNGVKFSLRAVRNWDEIQKTKPSYEVDGLVETDAKVLDSSESLFFPSVYKISSDVAEEAACYSRSYENVFIEGDEIRVSGTLERVVGGKEKKRRLVVGTLENYEKESMIFS